MNKLIHVFINNKNIVKISPFSSIYSLKKEIINNIPYYKNLNIEKINLHFNGKPLTNNNKSLLSYNFEDNSNIIVISPIYGGDIDSIDWLYIIYYIYIPIYLVFLASGLAPFIAHCFGYIFNITTLSILSYFYPKNHKATLKVKLITYFIKSISWVIKHTSIILFIWITSSYMIFPWLYKNKNDYCNSGKASINIGFWIMFIYILFYGSLNIGDFFLNIAQVIVDLKEIPIPIKAFLEPSIQTSKRTWDISKFGPLYAIPFVGEFFLFIHEYLEVIIGIIYQIIGEIKQFNCDDKNSISSIASILTGLDDILSQQSKGKTSKITNIPTKMLFGSEIAQIKNYKLEQMIKVLRRGFDDKYLKTSGKPLPLLKGTEWELGGFNRWSSSLFTSFFCQFLEMMNDIIDLIFEIGTENEVINMIKTGNFAGFIAAFTMFILFIYTMCSNSFAGYKYK